MDVAGKPQSWGSASGCRRRESHRAIGTKLTLAVLLGLAGAAAILCLGHSHALAACNPYNTACGYFTGSSTVTAWCNVLPDPNIKWSYDGYWNCGGTSWMYGVTNANTFRGHMSGYLWDTSGNAGYNRNANVGAAFLIDDMLGIDKYTTSPDQGINDARNNFNKWQTLINRLAAHQCVNNSAPTCPGQPYGINWAYVSPDFCSYPNSEVSSSAYDAGPPSDQGPNDAVLWTTYANDCEYAYTHSKPEFVFYWNNGANSFRMGSQCGNAEEITNPLIDNPPTGTQQLTCNPGAGDYTDKLTFSDPDGGTSAYISTAGHNSTPAWTSSPQTYTIPASWTNAYSSQVVQLWVKDVGLFGTGAYQHIVSADQWTSTPCATFGCGSLNVISPAYIDPFTSNYVVSVSTSSSVINQQAPNPSMFMQIAPPAGGNGYSGSQVPAFNNTNGVSTATFTVPGPPNVTGVFNVTWQFSSNGVVVVGNCPGSFSVVNLPYFTINGGDAIIGDGPIYNAGTNTTTCSSPPNSQSGVFSWNNHAAGFTGAGTEYAVQTLAQIEDFSSAQGSSSSPPYDLSFANSSLPGNEFNSSQGLFGGYLGLLALDNQACDFTSGLVNPRPGVLVNPPGTINLGQDLTIFASGDVYISHNIVYAGAGSTWGSLSQIPQFKLVVVGGNIYIGSGVTDLDGLYVAEPAAGVGGTIYTCAKGYGVPWNPTTDFPTYYAACKTPLTINGAFAANQVQLLRTGGSVGRPTTAAEVFNYTPELWLPRNNSAPSNNYAAISGLPPVL